MAVKNSGSTADSDDDYLLTLRDEEFMGDMDELADSTIFNDETGHIITVFRCKADETQSIHPNVFRLGRVYAYDIRRVNTTKRSTTVVFE